MRSASCYTNLRKTTACAQNTKVEYPGRVATNWNTLQAALPCNPNYTVQIYTPVVCGSSTCWQFLSNRKPK